MPRLVVFCLVYMLSMHVDAQQVLKVKEKHRSLRFSRLCSIGYNWQEIAIGNKPVEEQINMQIRSLACRFMPDSDDAVLICSGEMEFDAEAHVLDTFDKYISYWVSTYSFFKGTPHGNRTFELVTFSTETGKPLSVWETIGEVDSVVFARVLKQQFEKEYHMDLTEVFSDLDQITMPMFTVNAKGWTIYYRGDNYASAILSVFISRGDLRSQNEPSSR